MLLRVLLKFERLNKRFILYMSKFITNDLSVVKGKRFSDIKYTVYLFRDKVMFRTGLRYM